MHRFASLLRVAVVAAALTACGEDDGGAAGDVESGPDSRAGTPAITTEVEGSAFPGAATSLDVLGRSALEALVAGDTAVLAGFRLTESEHNEVVFPELPAGQPEVNYPVDLAWQNIQLRDGRAVSRQIAWFDGRIVEYVRTECRGETQGFRSFVVHTDCVVVFDAREGNGLEIGLFQDVVERGGGFKIFRYYDDPPRRGSEG